MRGFVRARVQRQGLSGREEAGSHETHRWREMDSNYWYRGTKSPLPKFPASTEYTGEFHSIGAQLRTPRQKIVRYASALRANSLRIRTGNFSSPCRELNQAITEFFGRIREKGAAIAALAS